MRTLFVAAGGGGDAVGTLLARQVLDPDADRPALITTCAWERLRIDPTPGPRPIIGFTGLGHIDGLLVEVLAHSDTRPPGRSMLPRLAAETPARIFVHDFHYGAHGLADHLRRLVNALDADRIVVVDVGGDVVASGAEATLLSPLADSLTLAGALLSEVPTTLAVIGPGVDGELSEKQVMDRLYALGAHLAGHITEHDVQRHTPILDWHPTEASALVAASAIGERGGVEMRRGTVPIPLTIHGCEVWLAETPNLENFRIASALASSTELEDAIAIIDRLAVNEIAYEQAKAQELPSADRSSIPLREVADAAIGHGATHITTRRLLEAANISPASAEEAIHQLTSSKLRVGPLWRLDSLRLTSG